LVMGAWLPERGLPDFAVEIAFAGGLGFVG
jgi:hypothetical protein